MQGIGEAVGFEAARFKRLEKQNRVLWLLLVLNSAAVLALCLNIWGRKNSAAIGRIETTNISLRDPQGRLIGEIGSQPGFGKDKDLYRPFIKFWDRGDEPVMALYGTGLNLVQGKQNASYDFLGVSLNSTSRDGGDFGFLVNRSILSYSTGGGQLMVFSKNDGMDLTITAFGKNGSESSVFGVLTGQEDSSMYVAAHKNEIDINADSRGTQIVRGKSQ